MVGWVCLIRAIPSDEKLLTQTDHTRQLGLLYFMGSLISKATTVAAESDIYIIVSIYWIESMATNLSLGTSIAF